MPKFTSIQQIQEEIREGKTDCRSLVEYYLSRIRETAHLNAYVEVFEKEALDGASRLDRRYQSDPSSVGRLYGVVISIKDVLCYKDHRVTAGSKILENFTSLYSATAVQRLLEEDAVIIGRTNCDEFAMGSTNETSYYGPVGNGADPAKVPGGSSGGSAVAVQTDTCLVSLGTDTGGSVRQPAAFCGIVGLKPGYGRISRHGLLAYGSSFDQVGIFSHTVEDAALLLEIMAGADDYDSTSSREVVPAYSSMLRFDRRARIACFPSALQHESLDPAIRTMMQQLIGQLRNAGHTVEEVDFKYLDYIIPAYYVLTTAEASSNLSRYDGIRYGYRSPDAADLEEAYKKSRTEGFGREVKRRIMLGTFVLSAGYYDAYYNKAQKVRRLILQNTREILDKFDFILMPSAPGTAWTKGESLDDPVAMYLADIFTVQANMTGMPAISLPIGFHPNGLPVGIQFMADKFREADLLAFSKLVLDKMKQVAS